MQEIVSGLLLRWKKVLSLITTVYLFKQKHSFFIGVLEKSNLLWILFGKRGKFLSKSISKSNFRSRILLKKQFAIKPSSAWLGHFESLLSIPLCICIGSFVSFRVELAVYFFYMNIVHLSPFICPKNPLWYFSLITFECFCRAHSVCRLITLNPYDNLNQSNVFLKLFFLEFDCLAFPTPLFVQVVNWWLNPIIQWLELSFYPTTPNQTKLNPGPPYLFIEIILLTTVGKQFPFQFS